jgi:U2 small nuclear ribonucleoprotein A'
VKDAERKQAKELFGTPEEPTELAKTVLAVKSSTSAFASGQATANGGKASNFKASDEEKKRFQALVTKASSLAEVQKLEKMYNEGRLPPGLMDGDAMDET